MGSTALLEARMGTATRDLRMDPLVLSKANEMYRTGQIAEDWHLDASCHGKTELFYPEGDTGRSGWVDYRAAYDLCLACPARAECLATAMRQETGRRYGVFGGMSPSERKALAKKWKRGE